MPKILQIVPAPLGMQVVLAPHETGEQVERLPVVCVALVEHPETGPEVKLMTVDPENGVIEFVERGQIDYSS